MNQQAEAEEYDEHRPPGFFARMRDRLMGHDDDEDEEDGAPESDSSAPARPPQRKTAPTLRLDQARRVHITVRRAVRGFEEARRAADGLKDGQQQIVNLEQTPVEMAERVVDFLNGATYALDGSVEKIGEQVYLFTPASVIIDIEDKPTGNSRVSFVDTVTP
ncbi:MAG: cell division protein SepF [Armatimonadetes bacterium]|nr:cell division protein SepF [Armatimonadota bacterium]